MTRYFVLGDAVHALVGDTIPEGGVEVDRLPGDYERLEAGGWELDCRLRADSEVGAAHISEARALKYIEALSILAGVPLEHGMLAAEATEKGVSLDEYARLVIEKRAAFMAVEVQRQVRQDGGEVDAGDLAQQIIDSAAAPAGET